jgi:hypothetical protein
MQKASPKNNMKNMIAELFLYYSALPNCKEKQELEIIIRNLSLPRKDIKSILKMVQSKIVSDRTSSKVSATNRDKNLMLWKSVLEIFMKYLRS